jgi:hypothetical protein
MCAFNDTTMQYYNYKIDMKLYMCNMFKDTYLIALKKDHCPRILDLENLIYFILEYSYDGSRTNSLNALACNHTNAIIIRIGIA